jgi:hypothetical protein
MPASWGPLFGLYDAAVVEGREFRVGLTRGRPLGYEFGVSFVRKTITEFTFETQGASLMSSTSSGGSFTFTDHGAARVTFNRIASIQMPGAEFHSFFPIGRFGERLQLGGLLGLGAAHVPSEAIHKRVEGPPYVADPETRTGITTTVPPGGAFVIGNNNEAFAVAAGETGVDTTADIRTISPLGSMLILARGQLALDVLLAAPFKVRFSGGFNYPGAQVFGIEAVYLFGTGR